MPVLKKSALDAYVKSTVRFDGHWWPKAPSEKTQGARYKQYGYGAPIRLTFRANGSKTRQSGAGYDESRSVRPRASG